MSPTKLIVEVERIGRMEGRSYDGGDIYAKACFSTREEYLIGLGQSENQ